MFEWTVSLSFSSGGRAGCGGWEDEDCYIQNRNFCSNLRPDRARQIQSCAWPSTEQCKLCITDCCLVSYLVALLGKISFNKIQIVLFRI